MSINEYDSHSNKHLGNEYDSFGYKRRDSFPHCPYGGPRLLVCQRNSHITEAQYIKEMCTHFAFCRALMRIGDEWLHQYLPRILKLLWYNDTITPYYWLRHDGYGQIYYMILHWPANTNTENQRLHRSQQSVEYLPAHTSTPLTNAKQVEQQFPDYEY